MNHQAHLSLSRLLPRLEETFAATARKKYWPVYRQRLENNFDDLFQPLLALYGHHYDFFYHLESILSMTANLYLARPGDLKRLDEQREANTDWFHAETMLGTVCYVDLFSGDFTGLGQKIPYFKELGITYLHLMPLFLAPSGNSDGGYAVSSYRQTNPTLGSMEDLAALCKMLRNNGISLVLDFIYNHTADEHIWAQKALAGDPDYQDYYYMFPDRRMPDTYDTTLREIFPDGRRGSFSYRPEIDRWVWTTFNDFQWDLNYSNPVVFKSMAEEMLLLANVGAEVLRLDAVAFAWKKLGTASESLPEVHLLVQAFNAITRIAAPAMLFKSEAIVHPNEVNSYIHAKECQLSYNPLLMALLWEALATRKVALLQASMQIYFKIDPQCAWINYVRSHDDIGWTFSDEIAASLNMNADDHRRFLNDFYTGRFPGSFARGLPFQENPSTGDARISGTCASLVGLERALHQNDETELDLAIKRIHLIYSIILSIGGIPLIYSGDEIGILNDYNYQNAPNKAGDSRWVHRVPTDWDKMKRRQDETTLEGRIYQGFTRLISLRKITPALAGNQADFIKAENPHVFAYVRQYQEHRLLVFANFSEQVQTISANTLRIQGLSYSFYDLILQQDINLEQDLRLKPYQCMWLQKAN